MQIRSQPRVPSPTLREAPAPTPHGPGSATLIAGTAGAVLLRAMAGMPRVAESTPGALCMAVAMITLALAAGWRPGLPRVTSVVVGIAGAAALVAVPALVRDLPLGWPGVEASSSWLGWGVALVLIVVGEEVVLRGVLFTALSAERGVPAAVLVTSVLFGLIHVPLYGWAAVPLDVAVGVWLAGLRLLTGGVAAPIAAHLGADLAALWLP